MAVPWAAIASGASGPSSALINAAVSGKMNHDSRNFALMQGDIDWQRQIDAFNMQNERDDSTWNRQNDYNLKMWEKENAYNSPAAMMARYKEAGLNPALIYGQSNQGGSVATANLDSGRITGAGTTKDWRPQAPDLSGLATGIADGVNAYYNLEQKSAQTDNLRATNNVLQEEARLKAAQTLRTLTDEYYGQVKAEGQTYKNASYQFQNDLETELRDVSVDARRSALRSLQVSTDLALNRDEREAAMNSMNLREGGARIQKLRGETFNLDLDKALKQMDLRYRGQGQPVKDYVQRTLGAILGSAVDSTKKGKFKPYGVTW